MKNNSIPIAGVIGSPIAHSKSPKLFQYWLTKYGISGHYIPLHVKPAKLRQAFSILPEIGFVGCNVTLPHKVAALEISDEATERAQKIGAANTLIFNEDGKIFADNTDGYGFITNLRQHAPSWQPNAGPALILGAGGAARAVIVALMEAGVNSLMLANRTKSKALILQEELCPEIIVLDWDDVDRRLDEFATVINTTSLGMAGQEPLPFSFEKISPATVVNDLVYNPLKTDFLQKSERRGCITVDGLGMLLHQAVPGFEHWFGCKPEVDMYTRMAVLE